MSYIQIHLTPRWNSLKTSCNQLQHTTVLEPYKNNTPKHNSSFIVLLIYVDDILIAGNDIKDVDIVKKKKIPFSK